MNPENELRTNSTCLYAFYPQTNSEFDRTNRIDIGWQAARCNGGERGTASRADAASPSAEESNTRSCARTPSNAARHIVGCRRSALAGSRTTRAPRCRARASVPNRHCLSGTVLPRYRNRRVAIPWHAEGRLHPRPRAAKSTVSPRLANSALLSRNDQDGLGETGDIYRVGPRSRSPSKRSAHVFCEAAAHA